MIYLGADHGGFELKETIKQWLSQKGIASEDLGASNLDPNDDYPDYAFAVAHKVAESKDNRGILLCRSGGGMTIAANRIHNVRAVDVFDEKSVKHAREHNNANVLVLGADWIDSDSAKKFVDLFLEAPFTGEERHQRRIEKLEQ